nr:unnamed protein product [Callosobruchus chinensis]
MQFREGQFDSSVTQP